jgi:optic atrophy protein 1
MVRKNLENKKYKVDAESIRDTWFAVYRKHFLNKQLGKTFECRKGYWMYQRGVEGEVSIEVVKI